jgi:hypothetical protein
VQAARGALRSAFLGKPWRGRRLEVRISAGRGGRNGVAYQVKGRPTEAGDPPSVALVPRTTDLHAASRYETLARVLDTASRSPDRRAAVAHAALAANVSARTVYRWLASYEAVGVRALSRARPCNTGQPRVQVSRLFDAAARAAGCSEILLSAITRDLERTLRGLWASRAEQAGGGEVRRLAEAALFEICQSRGLQVGPTAMRLSRRFVERFAAYRVVNQRRNDRKAYDDARPRIRRDWTGLLPMERVVADVKHLDVIVRREDGSPAWPKIIAFLDAGTGRGFVHPVLLERGEGVRQEHVIAAFIAMVSTPDWGFPQGLYLDNGSEFAALSKIDGALQLLNEPGARTLIFAQPYNASAKPIESLFARLDRQVFCLLPGYAGPNRMAKKTQTLGKPPIPYPGDWGDFCRTVEGLIRAQNHRTVGGARQGRSPQDWLAAKVKEGWRPAQVDALALDAAFSDPDSRRVDRGVLKISGQRYTHPRLAALPSRTVVDLALPWRRGAHPLAKLGSAWVYLNPEVLYPARWVEGARESDRRQRAQQRHVTALAKDAPEVDPVALKLRWGERQAKAAPSIPLPALDLGARPREQAAAIRKRQAEAVETTAPSAAELKRAREMAITERLERAQRRDD